MMSNDEWSKATQAAWSWLSSDLGFVATFWQAGPERCVQFQKDETQVAIAQELGGGTWVMVYALVGRNVRRHGLERLAATPQARAFRGPGRPSEEVLARSVLRAIGDGQSEALFSATDEGLGWVDGKR